MVATLALASLFPFWVAAHRTQSLSDDAYITLTYAKSLADGRGFVFNHPPATQGTTSPLLALLVAALAVLFPWMEINHLAVLFTALCWAGIPWVIYLFRRSLHLADWQAMVMGLVVIASGWVDFLGMEAYLFALLLVLGVGLFFSRHWFLAGLGVGFLFLARGEGALLLPLMLAACAIWNRPGRLDREFTRPLLCLAAGFLVPFLAWGAYALVTFGSVLPATLVVKMAQARSGLWPSFPQRLLEWAPQWESQFAPGGWLTLNLWWLLVILGVYFAASKSRRWLLFLAWMGIYIIGYSVLQVAAYWWYQLPILFVLQLFAALGLIQLVLLAAALPGKYQPAGKTLAVLAIVLVSGWLLFSRVDQVLSHEGDIRASSYLDLCRWLDQNTQPTRSVAFIEVGYLGYYTENRIVDLTGLTTPDIVEHVAESDFAWGFWQHEPDYYVYLADFDWVLGPILQDPDFERKYRPVAVIPGPQEADFVVYAHQKTK